MSLSHIDGSALIARALSERELQRFHNLIAHFSPFDEPELTAQFCSLLFCRNSCIAGGAAHFVLDHTAQIENVGDIDVFCRNPKAMRTGLCALLKDNNVPFDMNNTYPDMSDVFSPIIFGDRARQIQFISSGNPSRTLFKFDLDYAQCAIVSPTECLYTERAEECHRSRILRWFKFNTRFNYGGEESPTSMAHCLKKLNIRLVKISNKRFFLQRKPLLDFQLMQLPTNLNSHPYAESSAAICRDSIAHHSAAHGISIDEYCALPYVCEWPTQPMPHGDLVALDLGRAHVTLHSSIADVWQFAQMHIEMKFLDRDGTGTVACPFDIDAETLQIAVDMFSNTVPTQEQAAKLLPFAGYLMLDTDMTEFLQTVVDPLCLHIPEFRSKCMERMKHCDTVEKKLNVRRELIMENSLIPTYCNGNSD